MRPILLPGQFVSHVSAAVLWGLPVPVGDGDAAPVHITSVIPSAQPRRTGVIGHRIAPDRVSVTERWGVPASTLAALWIDCGALLTVDQLVVLGDAVVSEHRCRTTIDDLRRALVRAGARAGVRRLRAALELVRVGAGSPQETRARLAIVRAGLPEPELQVEIHDDAGWFVARVDMAYPRQRIVIEYEGDHHRTDAEQWASDLRRHREVERLGWALVRWSRSDLGRHRSGALDHLRSLLERRA
ncbi:endonuclease domain-containing protein [Curtobacterium sp. SP.BCo]|uniref:endonuclease domain-containing protein n=1 Tax=Curtobacterium sp. SP.BCo TaxID=3435229 RepID=UPI003F73C5B9